MRLEQSPWTVREISMLLSVIHPTPISIPGCTNFHADAPPPLARYQSAVASMGWLTLRWTAVETFMPRPFRG